MKRFIGGFLVVMLAALAVNVLWLRRDAAAASWMQFLLVVGIVPTVAGWATVRLVHLGWPRRVFDAPDRYAVYLPALGAVAGVVCLALIAVQATYLSAHWPDWSFGLGAAVIASLAVVLAGCRARRAGCCLRCGYDITHSLAAGRCPECGRAFAEVGDRVHSSAA